MKCTYASLSLLLLSSFAVPVSLLSQEKALVNTSNSSHAKLSSMDLGSVQWTQGFWAERFAICKDSMVPHLMATYMNPAKSHSFKNFEIAAGLDTGAHKGPPFHDGDFYKLFEAEASLYATTHDKKLDEQMDKIIAVIAKAQRPDGYIHTPVLIAEKKNSGQAKAFEDRLNFETYNIGHLMTAACVHYRATGKKTLLNVAIKAADYLNNFYKHSSPELARNAICPSHYMGIVEMYRTTRNPAYLELAKNLINIRGLVDNGTDDNQDRIPFRQQHVAMGHAVRANYLYAGVADVYAETGDDSLIQRLDEIWDDVVHRKMYITGGCGALYDGISPYGVSYQPVEIQRTQQAYGRDYQLPNMTAHNETCANIGNMLWNWRMLQLTGEAKYADVLEQALYNSVLSGVSLDGNRFFYTNPLSAADAFPYKLRWSGGRVDYISLSNCCPPNEARTISEVSDYMYSVSEKGIWLNLYGGNTLSAKLRSGAPVSLLETTEYPWDGTVTVQVQEAPKENFSFFLRIPGWCKKATLMVNGKQRNMVLASGQYAEVSGPWSKGDRIQLVLSMPAVLIEANPLVEETRNQVAVQRGPVVYCIESVDMPKGQSIFNIEIPASAEFKAVTKKVDAGTVAVLEGSVLLKQDNGWNDRLYKEISSTPGQPVNVTLIPYYAWGNRGHSEMSVWMPLSRK